MNRIFIETFTFSYLLFYHDLQTFFQILAIDFQYYHAICLWKINACVGTVEVVFAQEHTVGVVSADGEFVFCLCTVNAYYHLSVESLHEANLLAVALTVLNIADAVGC